MSLNRNESIKRQALALAFLAIGLLFGGSACDAVQSAANAVLYPGGDLPPPEVLRLRAVETHGAFGGKTSVLLSWSPPSGRVDTIIVERAARPAGPWLEIGKADPAGGSFRDEKPAEGDVNWYHAIMVSSGRRSAPTAPVVSRTVEPTVTPTWTQLPSWLTATAVAATAVAATATPTPAPIGTALRFTLTLSADPPNGGIIARAQWTGRGPDGSRVTISATPPAARTMSVPFITTGSPGDEVRLAALANEKEGFRFAGWSGACSGEAACTVTMDADKAVVARFVRTPP